VTYYTNTKQQVNANIEVLFTLGQKVHWALRQ